MHHNTHYNMHIASYTCCRDPAGPNRTQLCMLPGPCRTHHTLHYALQYALHHALNYVLLCMLPGPCGTKWDLSCITLGITRRITICIISVMHAAGTLRDPLGPYALHYALQYALLYAQHYTLQYAVQYALQYA